MPENILQRKDLIYPELSFQIVGCAYEVFNELGPVHTEKNYQKAFAVVFEEKKFNLRNRYIIP